MAIFNSMVADPAATNPESLNLSLTSNGVIVRQLGSNARAILFNGINGLDESTALVTVTANNIATRFDVDVNYAGEAFSILLTNGTAFEFNLDLSDGLVQTLTDVGYDSVSPEKLRRTNLEG